MRCESSTSWSQWGSTLSVLSINDLTATAINLLESDPEDLSARAGIILLREEFTRHSNDCLKVLSPRGFLYEMASVILALEVGDWMDVEEQIRWRLALADDLSVRYLHDFPIES